MCKKYYLLSTLILSPLSSYADCTAAIALPLSMRGNQTQFVWNGIIGGGGSGSILSACAISDKYSYDHRYNIVATNAECSNYISGKLYRIPVKTVSANIQTGPMRKLGTYGYGGQQFDI